MFLNKKEASIIETFYTNIDIYAQESMVLKWKDGSQILAIFDTCFEDDNDLEMEDSNYEEFTSFVFKALGSSGAPPVYITEDQYFCIDYRNFADQILVNGHQIN